MQMIMLKRFNALHIITLSIHVIIIGFYTVSYAYETQSNNKGRVTVSVRPVKLVAGQKEMDYEPTTIRSGCG